jgi:predicted nucleic acid-binding protein
VALLNQKDRFHRWATEHWADIQAPLLTCEPVLAEACFLLRHTGNGPAAVLELVSRGVVRVPFRIELDVEPIQRLLRRYANVPMSLADACLVRLAEHDSRARVFTLDDDFHIYRIHGRRVIPTLSPE